MKRKTMKKMVGLILGAAVFAASLPVMAQGKPAEYYGSDKIYFSHDFEHDHDEQTKEPKAAVPGESPAVAAGDTGKDIWSNLLQRYKPDGTENTQYCVFYQEDNGNMALKMLNTSTKSAALPLRKKLKMSLDESGKLKKAIVIEAKMKCAAAGTAIFLNFSKNGSVKQTAGTSGDTTAVNILKLNINKLQMFNGTATTAPTYADGSWVQTKAILDPADDSVALYVNGEFVGKTADCGMNAMFAPAPDAEDTERTDFYVNFFAYGKNYTEVYLDDIIVRETGDTLKIEGAGLYNAAGNEIEHIPNAEHVNVKLERTVENESGKDVYVKAIAALYNADGILTNVVLGEDTLIEKNTAVPIHITTPVEENEQKVSVFLWTQMEEVRPMCQKYTFTKQQL